MMQAAKGKQTSPEHKFAETSLSHNHHCLPDNQHLSLALSLSRLCGADAGHRSGGGHQPQEIGKRRRARLPSRASRWREKSPRHRQQAIETPRRRPSQPVAPQDFQREVLPADLEVPVGHLRHQRRIFHHLCRPVDGVIIQRQALETERPELVQHGNSSISLAGDPERDAGRRKTLPRYREKIVKAFSGGADKASVISKSG